MSQSIVRAAVLMGALCALCGSKAMADGISDPTSQLIGFGWPLEFQADNANSWDATA
jgi:hypothetical protein